MRELRSWLRSNARTGLVVFGAFGAALVLAATSYWPRDPAPIRVSPGISSAMARTSTLDAATSIFNPPTSISEPPTSSLEPPTPAVEPLIDERFEFSPPPFGERRIVPPDESQPAPSETAAYCAAGNWQRMDVVVGRSQSGAFRVDEDAWRRALLGGQAGLANWMSQCQEAGAPVEIVAATTGVLLATYDARSGLKSSP